MIDRRRIEGFEWDAGNSAKSAEKHSVSRAEAEEMFANEPLLVGDDPAHSQDEERYRAYGMTNAGRRLTVIFTLRAEKTLIRVISSRDMSRRERSRYDEEDA